MDKLLVIVIDSGTGRSSSLMKQLNARLEIVIQSISANMLRTKADLEVSGIQYSDQNSLKYLGRSMSLPEIGCAGSHNRARLLLAQSPIGGVILEDDGRICDLDRFIHLSRTFLLEKMDDHALLNFSNSEPLFDTCKVPVEKGLYYTRRISPTPLAVGYAITSSAAKRMLSNNDPVQYVSDWPGAGVSFFSPSHEYVHHGDGHTVSTIDPTQSSQRNEKSYLKSLSVLLGIHFILHASKFGIGFSYFQKVWWVTFSQKLSFLRGFKRYVRK